MSFFTQRRLVRAGVESPLLRRTLATLMNRLDSERLGTFVHDATLAAQADLGEREPSPVEVESVASFIVQAAFAAVLVPHAPSKGALREMARAAGLEAVRKENG